MLTAIRRRITALQATRAIAPDLRAMGYTIRAGRVGNFPAVLIDSTTYPRAAVLTDEAWELVYVHPADAPEDWSCWGTLAAADEPYRVVAAAIWREFREHGEV